MIRPYPLDDETLVSYYYRLSHLNCIPIRSLIHPKMLTKNYQFDDKLASTCLNKELHLGLKDEAVLSLCGRQFIDFHNHFHPLALYISPKFCPLCLMEANYYRMKWLIKLNIVCLKHGVFLLQRCSFCKAAFDQLKLLNGRCSCGRYISEMQVHEANDDSVFSQKLVEFMMGYNPKPIDDYHPVFSLPRLVFLEFVHHILSYVIFYLKLNSAKIIKKNNGDIEFLSEVWNYTITTLKDWPKSFHEFVFNLLKAYEESYPKRQLSSNIYHARSYLRGFGNQYAFFRQEICSLESCVDKVLLAKFFGMHH